MCKYSLSGVAQDAAFAVSSTHYMLLDLKVTRVFLCHVLANISKTI